MARSHRITLNGKEFDLIKDYSLKHRDDLKTLPIDGKLKYLEEGKTLVNLSSLIAKKG